MQNLEFYNQVRSVPDNAQKEITGGRLKGYTDINPQWRIEKLTEQFGRCGEGWKTEITEQKVIEGANGEKVAICNINLFYKIENEWSDALVGTGGSLIIASETQGLHTNDEAFKMAYTDAISVCCKMLGFGADIYWNKDETKYSSPKIKQEYSDTKQPKAFELSDRTKKIYFNFTGKDLLGWTKEQYNEYCKEQVKFGNLTNSYSPKWTEQDCEYMEKQFDILMERNGAF